MSDFTDKLVAVCRDEFARWDDGAGRETWRRPQHSKDYYLFVKDYWKSIGNNKLDGRTIVGGIRPAWSSAFVSFCMKKAGAGDRFFYTEAHCHYINRAMRAADGDLKNYGYIARKTDAYKPKVGDVICAGRAYAVGYDYDQAKLVYEADSFYPSHGDIVISMASDHIETMGGNLADSVGTKKLRLTDTGYLKNRVSRVKEISWVAILECVL